MRPFCLLLVLTGLAVPCAGQAQPPDPFTRMLPLHPGDQWTYTRTRYLLSSPDSVYVENLGPERWTVQEVSESGGVLLATLQQTRWGPDSLRQPGARCVLTRRLVYCAGCGAGTWSLAVEVAHEQGTCTVPGLFPDGFRVSAGFVAGSPYAIGGIPCAFDRITVNTQSAWPEPGPGPLMDALWLSGSDVGLLLMRWSRWEDGTAEQRDFALQHAEVGGQVYGAVPVATGGGAARPLSFGVEAAYPNPFHDAFTVRLALPEAGRVRVEVFDALGRRVLGAGFEAGRPGRHDVRIDGGHLAAGHYVVRATAADGRAATARLVRAD